MAPHLGVGTLQNLGECLESVSLCMGAVLADPGPPNLQEPVFLTQPLVNPASLLLAELWRLVRVSQDVIYWAVDWGVKVDETS